MRKRKVTSTIDKHPERPSIERDLSLGKPINALARRYKVSRGALQRHREKLPPKMKALLSARALGLEGSDFDAIRKEQGESLLAKLAHQQARLILMQDHCIAVEDYSIAAQISAQLHRNLELVGKYLGEFAQHSVNTNINIVTDPAHLRLRAALIDALRQYPEARVAVIAALKKSEAAALTPPTDSKIVDVTPSHVHVAEPSAIV